MEIWAGQLGLQNVDIVGNIVRYGLLPSKSFTLYLNARKQALMSSCLFNSASISNVRPNTVMRETFEIIDEIIFL